MNLEFHERSPLLRDVPDGTGTLTTMPIGCEMAQIARNGAGCALPRFDAVGIRILEYLPR